ncbi:patatin-like phospholipase family protein [Alterisphingorhabdus coralli]|uniref:Patatin-like phospholipase family protein n=1 Tax=Alterisphingorhabdus coralli TaxID=3071408 RepID=A0AA97F8U1_9SPHN|nr:patatin-like phospholipase family protein [Parasphingorhabdus sp. SCSIO 66989]WOE76509.1 patatin-like phospholipase family protein [Parasphingorhabdus sp. SCSIO 66989]
MATQAAKSPKTVDDLLVKKRREVREKKPKDQAIPLPETVALVLQGGGALGSYQAGVYEAMVAQDIRIDWVAGISIGAINSAIIAGNPFASAWERLREFWEQITSGSPNMVFADNPFWRQTNHRLGAFAAATSGVPGFYRPHMSVPGFSMPGTDNALSLYNTAPLEETLNKYVDWDRLNDGPMRLSVGAVDIESGNFQYFDTRDPVNPTRIDARHIMASGALPPGFPPIEIDGRYYWDGGIVSNTPLAHVLENQTTDMLVFQVDLFPARGKMPQDFDDVLSRMKDIRFSSRTRAVTDQYLRIRREHEAIRSVLNKLPPEVCADEDVERLRAMVDENAVNIVHLICQVEEWESGARDFEFSRATMERHWAQGLDAVLSVIKKRGLLAQNIIDGRTAAIDID